MNDRRLIHRNITFFARYYKLAGLAALITVTVIAGSIVTGDSVRTTLVERVTERLGDVETLIFSRQAFMAEELAEAPLFGGAAQGVLLTNGFISRNGRLLPVFVWGVDGMPVPAGSARLNRPLLRELGENGSEAIALRLPASGLVPPGSLFVTETYTTAMRLSQGSVVEAKEGGNISLKNEQILPLNIFVNRNELAEALELKGKINLILTNKTVTEAELEGIWSPSVSGLFVNRYEGFSEITSDRIFLQEKVVETIGRNNRQPNRLFSYLANSIEREALSIPYSFVTAADSYEGEPLLKDEVILSDYSAKRLQAQTGDSIRMTYFTSQGLKVLKTGSVALRVKRIVPIGKLVEDKTLSADFPGLSDVERCTDWDSDLPVDMDLITHEDEMYWEQYRSTPKAVIPYEAVAGDWSNAYGSATAVRVADVSPALSGLRPDMFGVQVIHPREAGLYAAKNGVDFSGLFLALGFFIIVSALLLMLVPLSEMLYQRRQEIALLKALGYSPKRITGMLWRESAPVVLVASAAGVFTGLLYTILIMWLLGSVWKGATHTEGFSVYPSLPALFISFLVGIGLSLWLLRLTIVRSLKEKEQLAGKSGFSIEKKRMRAVICSVLSAGVIGINLFFLQAVGLFVVAGILLMGTSALWGDYLICRNGSPSTNLFDTGKMIWGTLFVHRKQAALSFFALATGVFIVFSVGLNRPSFSDGAQLSAGTGGYSLWCESSVPVYHAMETEAGREKLSLTALPIRTEVLQCLRYSADDASCLNLNKVTTPTVLGVDMHALEASSFRIEQSLYSSDRESLFGQMRIHTDSVYPALVDATVLAWSLGMSLGDTLYYEGDAGRRIRILLAGTLSNSIFQGNVLIDRAAFSEAWPETAGSEVFLLKVSEAEKDEAKALLSQALNEYGVRVTATNERLKQFHTVTDTYLTIFMTLGSLGLLLGIMSFMIVIRKNLAARRGEIESYRMLGFTGNKIHALLYKENLLVPLYAVGTGVTASLAAAGSGLANAGVRIWMLALLFALLFVLYIIYYLKHNIMKLMKKSNLIYQGIALMLLTATNVAAQNQHGWRGPERNGIYAEAGLLKVWPSDGPEQAWEVSDIGKGYSSPVIVGGRLYITGMNEDETKEVFSAYTLDGKRVYQVVYGTPWLKSYPETRTTPTITGNKAYVVSGDGEAVCIDIRDGKILWTVNGNTEFGRKTGTWGTSESPLVFDGKVILSPGGEQTAIVALDAETGKIRWKSRSLDDISNYASPLLITHKGKKQIVTLTGKSVIGVNPENGNIEWTFDDWGQSAVAQGWEKISPNTPLYKDGKIFVCNGYDMGSFLLELNDNATGVKLLWRNDDLDTHVGGFVLVDGTLYGSNWINNGQGNWTAVDWNTGATKYNTAWSGGKSKGSVITADNMLYCYDERRGIVGLVNINPEKFDVVSEFRITKGEGPHWAHPVINDGTLFIRHGSVLMAYKIR